MSSGVEYGGKEKNTKGKLNKQKGEHCGEKTLVNFNKYNLLNQIDIFIPI